MSSILENTHRSPDGTFVEHSVLIICLIRTALEATGKRLFLITITIVQCVTWPRQSLRGYSSVTLFEVGLVSQVDYISHVGWWPMSISLIKNTYLWLLIGYLIFFTRPSNSLNFSLFNKCSAGRSVSRFFFAPWWSVFTTCQGNQWAYSNPRTQL